MKLCLSWEEVGDRCCISPNDRGSGRAGCSEEEEARGTLNDHMVRPFPPQTLPDRPDPQRDYNPHNAQQPRTRFFRLTTTRKLLPGAPGAEGPCSPRPPGEWERGGIATRARGSGPGERGWGPR